MLDLLLSSLVAACPPAEVPSHPQEIEANVVTDDAGILIASPEAFELATILIFMTDYGYTNRPSNFFDSTEYSKSVRAWFEPHRDHPIFDRLGKEDFYDIKNFIGMREGAYPFSFSESGELEKTDIYLHWWSPNWGPLTFEQNHELIEDFARTSRFRDFYRLNRPFYEAQQQWFLDLVDLERVNDWLSVQFPSHFERVTVIFSPLIRGRHSASTKKGECRSELRVIVGGPYMKRIGVNISGELLALRQVFTEIDHGFVDPSTAPHRAAIEKAFARGDFWRKGAKPIYGSAYSTFNEYMTWAAFLLYTMDTLPPEDHLKTRTSTIEYMEDRRGFITFSRFYEMVERRYAGRGEGETIATLLPSIIAEAEDFAPQ